ncbi:MAG: hypothetical protein E5X33_26975 [Mesorhizobium sp.]|uniref:hypothetical protein n=1 Tax=Mesorhizobium sp. TaxID=1871066 RepID=UPI00121860F2|nr:hypothetical protein [Mesorhizobium sp.]TIR17092.1 MAG: hypothetical protein E5X33_26975 [Mesorhizobium sp.]
MTPLTYNAWLFQISLSACVVAGLAIVMVSVRTGWIAKAIAITTALYGLTGGLMILSPKWSEVVFEYKDFKTRISQLQDDNAKLASENTELHSQIQTVAALGEFGSGSAAAAINRIRDTRQSVHWAAQFLPADRDAYRLAISPDNADFANEFARKLNSTPEAVTQAFETSGYTILKKPTSTDLSNSDARSLWIGTGDKK